VRGPAGFPLYDAVAQSQSLLERFGGHQAACGVTVALDRLDEFREQFTRACQELPRQEVARGSSCIDFDASDKFSDVLADLYLLEPCGQDNPAPTLRVRGQVQAAREVRGGHLRLELSLPGSDSIVGFGPNLGNWAELLGERAVVEGQLRPDRYRGGGAVELLLTAVSRD
jgi:single-stranded-DNA-specific exonuclease